MTITKEGSFTSFYTVNKAPIKHLKVYFSPKQIGEGDPSLENVMDIEGQNIITINCTNNNNVVNFNNEPLNSQIIKRMSAEPWMKTNDFICFLADIDNTNGTSNSKLGIRLYKNNIRIYTSSSIEIAEPGQHKIIGMTLAPITYGDFDTIEFMISGRSSGTIYHNAQVTYRNIDKKIIPYIGKTYTLDWSNTLGTIYGGYVDLITGQLIKTQDSRLAGSTNLSTTISTTDSGLGYMVCKINTLFGATEIDTTKPIITNMFKQIESTSNIASVTTPWTFFIYKSFIVFIGDNTLTNANDWNNLFSQISTITITANLINPVTYQLTPMQLQTFIGQNNIWSNADRVEVEYDLAESNDELYRRRNIILQGAPHLESISGNIANFNTDLIAPIKDAKIYFNPVQEGSEDPSPSNVRPITGWTGVTAYKTGKNLLDCAEKSTLSETRVSLGSRYGYYDVPLTAGTYTLTIGYNSSTSYNIYYRGQSDSGGVKIASASTMQMPYVQMVTFTLENSESYYFWTYLLQGAQRDNIAWFTLVPGGEALIPTTFSVTFPVTGKNLFDQTYYEDSNNYTDVFSGYAYSDKIQLKPNTTYTFKSNATSSIESGTYCYVRVISGTDPDSFDSTTGVYPVYNGNFSGSGVGNTFTTGATGVIRFGVPSGGKGRIPSIMSVDWQLEEGSSATTYEPYTNTLYGGYVDLVTGEVWKTHEIVDLGTKTWTRIKNPYSGLSETYLFYAGGLGAKYMYKGITDSYKWAISYAGLSTDKTAGYIYYRSICIRDDSYTDVNDFKSAMNGVHLAYELETPVLIGTITPQHLKSLKGTNNIFSDANGNITVQYWKY